MGYYRNYKTITQKYTAAAATILTRTLQTCNERK